MQVEHTVTEEITGIDLVKAQIKVRSTQAASGHDRCQFTFWLADLCLL